MNSEFRSEMRVSTVWLISAFFLFFVFGLPGAEAFFPCAQGQDGAFWNSESWKSDPNARTERFHSMTFESKDLWYGSHYWKAADWGRIGKNWLHPGSGAPAVLTFTAPRAGSVWIRGTTRKLHSGGDGVEVRIEADGAPIWKGSLAKDAAGGISHDVQAILKVGSTVRFFVSSGPTIFCDTTGWNPAIQYEDEIFTAAEGFAAWQNHSDSASSAIPWSYSVEDPKAKPQAVTQAELNALKEALKTAVSEGYEMPIDAALWRLLLAEWKREDAPDLVFETEKTEAESTQSDAAVATALLQASRNHLKGMRSLFEALQKSASVVSDADRALLERIGRKLTEMETQLQKWSPEETGTEPNAPGEAVSRQAAVQLYFQIRIWKRSLILANPLVKQCGPLLFVKRRPTSYDHLVMQYFGWRAQRGGGIFVLQNPGRTLECRDLLNGKLEGGNVADPCLSWDGKKIIFSYVEIGKESVRFPWKEAWTPKVTNEKEESHHEYYHLYEMNSDGSDLQQLTFGSYEDLMPAYLPDGSIVFSSSRRKGHPRCFWWGFGERWTNYTIHKMNSDGSDLHPLSWHETNEWYPAVSHDGQIVYARWDYIDRDAVTHQNLWSMRPDGTNPTAVWGNASLEIFSSFQAKPIPESRKWLLTASAHHACTGGSLVILDPSAAKDGPKAIERITPEIPFPEAEGNDIPQFYASPWPLSEDFYLTAYSPYRLEFEPKATRDEALGLYVLDRFGNRELLYRDPQIGCDSPQPLAARPVPPVLPSFLPENPPDEGRFFVQDVYQGLGNVERGTIKALRIVQIFPKTTLTANDPPIGLAGEENGRAILGTVPVEADGSVNFIAPARKPILFQALNEKGEAFQIMRTLTYLQPGEEIACIGCHEDRTSAVGGNSPYFSPGKAAAGGTHALPLAAARAPSKIEPGKFGGRPFSFMEAVQPVLNAKCVSCHGGDPENEVFKKTPIDLTSAPDGAFTKSYVTLMKREGLVPRWPQRNRIEVTVPGGENGSIGSGLKKVLADENHRSIQLTPEEWANVAAWIDQNAIFYGTTEKDLQEKQLLGQPVPMQELQ